jgi:hypothetical protein
VPPTASNQWVGPLPGEDDHEGSDPLPPPTLPTVTTVTTAPPVAEGPALLPAPIVPIAAGESKPAGSPKPVSDAVG